MNSNIHSVRLFLPIPVLRFRKRAIHILFATLGKTLIRIGCGADNGTCLCVLHVEISGLSLVIRNKPVTRERLSEILNISSDAFEFRHGIGQMKPVRINNGRHLSIPHLFKEDNITVIPASKTLHSKMPLNAQSRRKVAGYARVSTDSEEQLTSYEAQVDYYTKYIRSNPDWEFVDVYTDEGIFATNTRHRDGFNRMIADALAGKIDLIVTKSVSRFARNTVDSLTAVRKLKEHGTEVYFEKEGIYTFDSKGELLITIMSSLAQEESRSISENVTWGQRKRFADGKVSLPYKSFLGYRKGPDGLPEIVPEEAEIVREIYKLFVQGKTVNWIATHLTSKGIPTPRGKEKWQTSTIESILTNEKYKGSAVLQKKFTVDFLSKKMKVNEGEVPQYIVDQSHPAIIDPEEWQKVQNEMAVRKAKGKHHNSLSPFSAKIVCGDCGEFYGSKV